MMRGLMCAVVVAVLTVSAIGMAGAAQFAEIVSGSFPSSPGLAWGDYDGDGYPDLFLSGGTAGTAVPVPHGPLLYRNNHDLTFTEVGESFDLEPTPVEQWGAAWGDYDNNGSLDLLVGGGGGYPFLYRRDPEGFLEVAEEAGFHVSFSAGRGTTWCDYDSDNLLDAFCSNIFGPGYLMGNNGDGTFTEMSAFAGMTGDASNESAQSASWGDYDNDGWPDLVLARLGEPTKLFRNNGDGTFEDVSDASGVSGFADAHSAIWGDYDNDGWLDLYATSASYLVPSTRRDALFHNNGDDTFTEVGETAGMASDTRVGGGAAWADYDNDGYLDLYVGNWGEDPFLYHNDRDGTFTNMVTGSGLQITSGYQSGAAAWADIDLDGRLDLLQGTFATGLDANESRLFRNIGYSGNWLRLRALTSATGAATAREFPAREAIGARVELNLDNDDTFPSGRTLTRLIDGGSGYCAQNEQVAHFGVGSAAVVCVRARFPDGSVVTHRNVAANQQIVIRDVPADRTEEPFEDIPLDFWAYEQVEGCVGAGIVAGYDDGMYHGDWPVDRATMAVYIARALAEGEDYVPTGPAEATFEDVPTDYWAYDHVEYCYDENVVQGYTATTYEPTVQVTRDQMAVYVARAMVAPTGEAALDDYVPADPRNFPDVPNTGYGEGGTEPFWAYTPRTAPSRPRHTLCSAHPGSSSDRPAHSRPALPPPSAPPSPAPHTPPSGRASPAPSAHTLSPCTPGLRSRRSSTPRDRRPSSPSEHPRKSLPPAPSVHNPHPQPAPVRYTPPSSPDPPASRRGTSRRHSPQRFQPRHTPPPARTPRSPAECPRTAPPSDPRVRPESQSADSLPRSGASPRSRPGTAPARRRLPRCPPRSVRLARSGRSTPSRRRSAA